MLRELILMMAVAGVLAAAIIAGAELMDWLL